MTQPKPAKRVSIRNMLWPAHGRANPTLCTEEGEPLAGQTGVEIRGNVVVVTFVVDGEGVRFE